MQHEKAEVVPFLRQSDALLTAPSNVLKLQSDETLKVLALARSIARTAYNRAYDDLGRREQATCRYLGSHALRMTSVNWQDAALYQAVKACDHWMQHDGGAVFREMTPEQREAIALFLVPRILTAHQSITEGSGAMTPGRYLAIVEGRGL